VQPGNRAIGLGRLENRVIWAMTMLDRAVLPRRLVMPDGRTPVSAYEHYGSGEPYYTLGYSRQFAELCRTDPTLVARYFLPRPSGTDVGCCRCPG
jgi:hypothetical protein